MLKVHCIPQKILYENTSDDYKVLSCKYIDSSEEMELSKYNSFTLSYNNFKLKLTIIQYFFIFPFVLLP